MKRLMIAYRLLNVALLLVFLFAVEVGATYYFSGSCSDKQCEICLKPIQKYYEGGDGSFSHTGGGSFCHPISYNLQYSFSINTCRDCFYLEKELRELLQPIADKWLKDKQEEFKAVREKHTQEAKTKELQEIQRKINELRKRQGELK